MEWAPRRLPRLAPVRAGAEPGWGGEREKGGARSNQIAWGPLEPAEETIRLQEPGLPGNAETPPILGWS